MVSLFASILPLNGVGAKSDTCRKRRISYPLRKPSSRGPAPTAKQQPPNSSVPAWRGTAAVVRRAAAPIQSGVRRGHRTQLQVSLVPDRFPRGRVRRGSGKHRQVISDQSLSKCQSKPLRKKSVHDSPNSRRSRPQCSKHRIQSVLPRMQWGRNGY